MDERAIDDLERSVGEQLEDRWQKPSGRSLGHVGADPLLRGLDIDIPFRDSEEQQAFLEEAGHTLRAAINGLRALQQTQNDSKYPLRDRRLQPIEDNPLRLGQAYEATVETMFSAQRSPVHLSAPEAVGECLRHQGHHQAAVEEAIEYALTAILDAFSPEALLKRFHAYRGAGTRIEDENSWAWEMYRHYYHELNSGRQLGFQKLFWEVFEQAYDQSVRKPPRTVFGNLAGGLGLVGVLLVLLSITGCASTREAAGKAWEVMLDPSIPVGYPEDQPTLVDLSMVAEPDVNPNIDGEGTPLRFQILQLKDDSMLMAADMDQLSEDMEAALGTNYLTHDDFTLLPGQWKFYEPFAIEEDTRYIGLIAFYAEPNEAEWKKVVKVKASSENYHLLVHLRNSEVELRKEE